MTKVAAPPSHKTRQQLFDEALSVRADAEYIRDSAYKRGIDEGYRRGYVAGFASAIDGAKVGARAFGAESVIDRLNEFHWTVLRVWADRQPNEKADAPDGPPQFIARPVRPRG